MSNTLCFGYKGEVKVQYSKNGKVFEFKRHNEGFSFLFKTIASLLAGEGFPYGSLSYISLERVRTDSSSTPSTETTKVLFKSTTIPITQKPKSIAVEDGDGNVAYACSVNTTIAYSDMVDKDSGENNWIVSSETINDKAYLYLLSANNTKLARVELSPDSVNSISPGVQLFIQWNLIVNNAQSSQ